MARPRSILIVSQHTPPSPLVGGRRAAALTKELSRRGHSVTVLTSPASGAGPVSHAVRTVRCRDLLATPLNWRRSNLTAQQGQTAGTYQEASQLESVVVPDISLLSWVPFAALAARRLVRAHQIDCVITTGPPQSAHLVGPLLRRTGAAWIADLRDGWTYDPPHEWAHPALAAIDRRLEERSLRRADLLVAVTEPISRDLRARLGVGASTITNGFDPEDEPVGDLEGIVDPGRFTVAYTGRLGVAGRRPRALLDAMVQLRDGPDMDRPPQIVFAGAVTREEEQLLNEERYAGVVRTAGMLRRPLALALQRAADVLVVIAAGEDGYPSPSVATGKLFEYIGARRPILVIGDHTEAARIVFDAGIGEAVPAGDPHAIAAALRRLASQAPPDPEAGAPFAWPALAEQYEEAIEQAVSAYAGGSG